MADWKKVELSPAHNFEEEKELIGVFTGKDENVGENNSTIYHLEKQDGEMTDVWGSTVLDVRLKNIKVGEEVKIVYNGKKPSPNRKGKFYHDFEVYHRATEFSQIADEVEL